MNVDKHQASGITQYTKQAAVCWHSVQFHDMSFTSLIIWTNATEWSTWILIFQHKSVPLGSFGCVSLFPQVDHFCLFGLCLHSPARILSPSVPYSPQAEELVDHAEMVDGFGHLRWMRDSLTRSDGSSIGQLNQTEINLKILQEDLKAVHTVHISWSSTQGHMTCWSAWTS